uniref:Craniofacial development protein 2 n=1 Tax=Cacopsylla melanoneura TaxID=428564 RepID=A0A8D8L8K4_9HEMI
MAFVQRYRKQRKTTILLFPGQIMIMADECNGPEYGRPLNGTGVLRISQSASVKIGTWNVQSMYQSGKLENTMKEMKRINISILGISEMRWTGSGKQFEQDHVIYYSGDDTQHKYGVGIIVTKELNQSVKSFTPISNRIILLQIESKPANVNIFQVYAPTAQSTEEDLELFYKDLEYSVKKMKSHDITVVMGDLNAKVGEEKYKNISGQFGLGTRNDRGSRFLEFCEEHKLSIMNTFFKLPKRRLYTWRAPGDTYRNQIDYITINHRYKNSITSSKTLPGADVPSDHVLLLCEFKLRLKKVKTTNKSKKICVDTIRLMKEELQPVLEEKCIGYYEKESPSIDEKWNEVKSIIQENVMDKVKKQSVKFKPWITDEILNLMEVRRPFKNTNHQRYKDVNKEIKRKIRDAKQNWLEEQCKEMEDLEKKHDSFNLYKKIKELAGLSKKNINNNLMDEDGHLIINTEDKMNVWKQYIEDLFDDDRPDTEETEARTGKEITISEIQNVIKTSKNRKAPGPDAIPSEVYKVFGPNSLLVLKDLFNEIYNTGKIPQEWLESIFVAIPKKARPKTCKDYRTISLMCHVLKLFLKIIQQRTYHKIEEKISHCQFGFRNGLGTREALFSIQVLIQKFRDNDNDAYLCFIDFEKAFDRIKHDKLIEILEDIGIDDKDVRIIRNLYWQQSARVRIEGNCTDPVNIKRGTRQGCVLSPQFFNIYSEYIFNEALANITHGIKIGNEIINNIRYADDTVLLSNSIEELQILVDKITSVCDKYGLKLNTSKTKFMIVSKKKNRLRNTTLKAYGIELERTASITYLGSYINDEWDIQKEIKIRIEKARTSFFKFKNLFCGHEIKLSLKLRMLRCYVFSVLLYGVESWTLTETIMKKIEAFEMWTYRRILKIKWTDKITNEEVLRRLNKDKEILFTIKKRKLEYFGHIVRNPTKYHVPVVILEGSNTTGNRGRGRPRTHWIQNLIQWFNVSNETLFEKARDRNSIATMIANDR